MLKHDDQECWETHRSMEYLNFLQLVKLVKGAEWIGRSRREKRTHHDLRGAIMWSQKKSDKNNFYHKSLLICLWKSLRSNFSNFSWLFQKEIWKNNKSSQSSPDAVFRSGWIKNDDKRWGVGANNYLRTAHRNVESDVMGRKMLLL